MFEKDSQMLLTAIGIDRHELATVPDFHSA
jgi:hypothetical protein